MSGARFGELDIQGPQRGRRGTLGIGAPRRQEQASRIGPSDGPTVMIPGARSVTFVAAPCRRSARVGRDGSCDDAGDAPPIASSCVPAGSPLRSSGWLAGRRRPAAAHGPAPAEPPDAREPAARLDVRAAARRSRSRSRSAGGGGRSGGSTRAHPGQSRAAPPVGRLRARRMLALAFALHLGHRALRHDALLGPHGPAHPADAGRGAAHRPGRADHAAPAASRRRRRASAGSCRCSTRASMRVLAFPVVAWLIFAVVMWVVALLAAVQRGPRGPVRPRPRARPLPRQRRSSSGGRRSRSTRRRGGWAIPARLVHVFLQMTQNTFLAVVILFASGVLYAALRDARAAAGGRPRSTTSGWPPAIMWIVGDLIFLTAIMAIVAGWIRSDAPRRAPGPTATPRSRWPRSGSASSGPGRAAGARARRAEVRRPGRQPRRPGSAPPGTRDSGSGRRCRR